MGIVALVLVQHQHRYCKKFHQKYSTKAWEQSNQSHPPFSIPITSQCGCYFAPHLSPCSRPIIGLGAFHLMFWGPIALS
jgi:hypothetical protein